MSVGPRKRVKAGRGRTCSVFKQLRKSPSAVSTSSERCLFSVTSSSESQIVRSRFVSIALVGGVKRMILASGRRGRRTGA